jgi:hypothetical protein
MCVCRGLLAEPFKKYNQVKLETKRLKKIVSSFHHVLLFCYIVNAFFKKPNLNGQQQIKII